MEGVWARTESISNHERLVESMRKELGELLPLYPVCSIYRVPETLRRLNEKACTPRVVSIGPFHHGKESLKPMEEHKKRYLQNYLHRNQVSLEDCISKIKSHEAKLRSCYAETVEFTSDHFVKMILVDAAFIVEILLGFRFPILQNNSDRIFNRPWMFRYVWPDMLLLENQLPFFILEELYDMDRIERTDGRLSMIDLCSSFFISLMNIHEMEEDNLEMTVMTRSSEVVEHFVDLYRRLHLPPSLLLPAERVRECDLLELGIIPSIAELHRVGVEFRVAYLTRSLLDIRFIDGVLEIPKLVIHDKLEYQFRNLVAFEQSHCMETIINGYLLLLSGLVNSSEDVKLLISNGILESRLDFYDTAIFIRELADGVIVNFGRSYYSHLAQELNCYHKLRSGSKRYQWKLYLKENFFNSPWATKEIIAAVIFLLLTIVQTICSLISI